MGHKDNFPDDGEVVRRLVSLEEWQKYTNRILFSIVLGSIGCIGSFAIWVGTVQTDVTNNRDDILTLSVDHHDIETRIGQIEVANSDIKARLISIEATLQEIKTSISRIR